MNNLCACGCGNEVKYSNSVFLRGHANRLVETKEKKKRTCLKHYGTEYPLQSKKIQNKHRITCLEHFGTDNPSKDESIKKKKIQTCLNHYGVEYPGQSEYIKEKMKNSMICNVGVEWAMQSKEIQEKSKQTNLINRGVCNPGQSKDIKEKIKQTCLSKYGVSHFSKTSKGRQLCRENYIRMIEISKLNGDALSPRIGLQEPSFFNDLQTYTQYKIIRTTTQIIGYYPDGYISELKLFIQFDERQHFTDNTYKIYTEKDQQCTKDLESLGYKVFRVSEKDWKENKEIVIEQFLKLINNITCEVCDAPAPVL